jgi:hypothetical protein
MHEAGHAVAFAWLCGQTATATLFHKGGECQYGSRLGPIRPQAIALAAGPAAAIFALIRQVPGRRPRKTYRCTWREPVTSDSEAIRIYSTCVPEDFEGLTAVELSAAAFVWDNLDEIVSVARRLFVQGRIIVPAKSGGKV